MSYVIRQVDRSSGHWISEPVCYSCDTQVSKFDEGEMGVCKIQ